MFHKMIRAKRDNWYLSSNCTVKNLIKYIINKDKMRDAQIDAIKTFLFLKIACDNKPLPILFSEGYWDMLF